VSKYSDKLIPLQLICKGIIFCIILVNAGCDRHQDDSQPNISLQWKDDKATGVSIPRNGLEHIQKDSLSTHVQVRLLKNSSSSIAGSYTIQEKEIIFEPLIPFTRGLRYGVYVSDILWETFIIPKETTVPTLVAVYPRGDSLPENLLKIYLEFSQPMKEGHSLEYVHLLNAKGDTLPDTFLNLESELWNEEGNVLTLWLDPGRIKRDLQPNKRLGPPLTRNSKYKLVVNGGWPDKKGSESDHPYVKNFVAVQPDTISPSVASWKLSIPAKSTRKPLQINTIEALDYFLLMNTITILDAAGHQVSGVKHISNKERTYSFTPESPWAAGDYTILVEERLADLAGNNLNRLFDVDLYNSKAPKNNTNKIKWSIN
jgi:hypothetical protein